MRLSKTLSSTNAFQRFQFSKAILILGIFFNLGLLGYFKYLGFFVQNINLLTGFNTTVPHIILPLGISFITFQKIAYLVDQYQGKVGSQSLLDYMLFVTFFPQLISGSIVHHRDVFDQFSNPHIFKFSHENFTQGFNLFVLGLSKK